MVRRKIHYIHQAKEFEGKLTSSKWAQLGKCSHDTALRDIEDLVRKGVLKKGAAGGGSTSYSLVAPREKGR